VSLSEGAPTPAARGRILGGMLVLVIGLAVYALLVMRLAVEILPEHWAVETVFYAAAGVLWVWPAARLVRWAQRG
jgi:hypothetical protein